MNEPLQLVTDHPCVNPRIEVEATPAIPEKVPDPGELLREVNELGEALRALIVTCKRLPRDKALEAHQEPARSLALAQAHLQTGFLWLRRALNPDQSF